MEQWELLFSVGFARGFVPGSILTCTVSADPVGSSRHLIGQEVAALSNSPRQYDVAHIHIRIGYLKSRRYGFRVIPSGALAFSFPLFLSLMY